MFTSPRKPVLAGVLVLLVAGLVLLAIILFTATPAPAVPTITWTPSSVTQTISPGESRAVSLSFTASENVSDVVVRVVPKLQPMVQADPAWFASIAKGQAMTVNLTVSVPLDSPLGTFQGTVQLRARSGGKEAFGKPLPITVNVWNEFQGQGYALYFPPDWSVDTQGSSIFLSSPTTSAQRSDPDAVAVPADIRVQELANPGHLDIRSFALGIEGGWFSRYPGQVEFMLDSRAAMAFSSAGTSTPRAPVLGTFVVLSPDRVLLLTAAGFETDLTVERSQVFSEVVRSLTFQ